MSKVKKEMDNFFLKEFKKTTGTTEQEQNISLSSKEIIFSEPFPFNGFLTNTMTENPASLSNPELPTIKCIMQSLPSRSYQFILT